MRTEFVYSIIAMGAIPVVVNAADVPGISGEALVSVDGSKVSIEVGELVKGSYTFKASLTSKVYGVKVTIAGTEVTADIDPGNPTNVSVDFELTEKTNVVLEFESTDVGVSGATFTVANAVVSLNFDFAGKKALLAANAEALAGTINDTYHYAAKQEDVDAANALKTKAEGIEESYDDYKKFELYATKSTIQKEIDALDEAAANKEAVYQNDQAYSRVNAAITAIKGKYNTAVANLEATLVDAAEYLLNDAKDELNTEINVKITEATQASYASHNAGTAVDDEATNMGKIPSEDTLNEIVADWTGQANDNKNAYSDLQGTVKDLQDGLDAIAPEEAIASQFATEKAEAQAAIDAVNGSVVDVYNSADQLTLGDDDDFKAAVDAAEGKINTLADKVTTANAEYNAWQDALTTIGELQTNLNTAKETVDAKKSADGQYEAKDYYADYVDGVQGEIDDYTAGANKAYNEDHNAVDYNDNLDVSGTQGKIEAYQANAIAAVDKYDELQVAIGTYENELEAARTVAQQIGPDVYTDPNYDYETKFNLIQKRINDIKKAITTAQGKVGAEHWTAMININKDAAISADIATLLSKVQADQNQYDADFLAEGMTELEGKIAAFEAKTADDTVFGADYETFQGVEDGIEAAYDVVKTAKNAIDSHSETWNYTAKVGTEVADWEAAAGNNHHKAKLGNGQIEHYEGSGSPVGDMLWQEVAVENGTYNIKVKATSHNANGGASLEEPANDVAYVFGKSGNSEVKKFITARKNNDFVDGEPEVYTIPGVKVENGKLTIGLSIAKAGQTNWHTIQIESLEANTASLIQGWGAKVADLNSQQDALETAANDVAAKVAANATAKSTLATAIGDNTSGMVKEINDFKTLYKIGSDESTLGNRGKAGGSITTEVGEMEEALGTLQTANGAIDPAAVSDVEKTNSVNKHKAADGWNTGLTKTGNFRDWTVAGIESVEHWISENNNTETGEVFYQVVKNLPNGVYDVELYANAVDQKTAGTNGAAYVFANEVTEDVPVTDNATADIYSLENVVVSDGTLKLGMMKTAAGTNWHSIQIKSLMYHENDQLDKYNNEDPENLGLNNKFTALNTELNKLKQDAPGIKTAVEHNAEAYGAAQTAMGTLNTFEVNNLKSLKNVTDADAVNTDAVAKKEAPEGYFFKVFDTELAEDKTYSAQKTAIDATIAAMNTAIANAFAAETMPYPWNDEITVTTEDDPETPEVNEASSTTYKVSDIQATITALKTEAGKESDNWEAYKALLDNNMSKLLPDTISVDAADLGEGAVAHYQGLKDDYIAKKAAILEKMQADLIARKAVSTKDAIVEEINALIAKVKVVKSDGVANKKKYDEQVAEGAETQTLWNNTYTEIAATDHSSEVQAWLDKLDEIQVDLTKAINAVEENYPKGESVAKAQDFSTIKTRINTVKNDQEEAYSAYVALDNANAHVTFVGGEIKDIDGNVVEIVEGFIQKATKAYQDAVTTRASYTSEDAGLQEAINGAAAEVDEAIFNCPTEILNLTNSEKAAYEEVVSPDVFDVSEFNIEAVKIANNISGKINEFETTVGTAIANFWSDTVGDAEDALVDAYDAIAGYSEDAQEDAFKDVEDLINLGYEGVYEKNISKVEEAVKGLANINDLLDADKDAAAAKDIDAALDNADHKYAEVKTYINSVDDKIAAKGEQLNALEGAYSEVAAVKQLPKDFENHDQIVGAANDFITTAEGCKVAVETAVTNDANNTKAYNEIIEALNPVEAKLAEAAAAAAPYKYETSFADVEDELADIKKDAADYRDAGSAVAHKDGVMADIEGLDADIEATLTGAFYKEKAGLAGDITELKNQFNTYVAKHGLDDQATAFKSEIDALADRLTAIDIEEDQDDPADGQYDEILEATANLIVLQEDIAAEQSELLKANESDANATVLADFQAQLQGLSDQVNITGLNEWVGEQKVDGKTINSLLEEINGQIATVSAAIEAEPNIAFYKDQYQTQIDAIADDVKDVTDAIAAKQAQWDANAQAYATLTAQFNELQGVVTAAKEKVDTYEYVGPGKQSDFTADIEEYDEDGKLVGGVQFAINTMVAWIEAANEAVQLDEDTNFDDFIEQQSEIVKDYLDKSAYNELATQCGKLNTLLNAAIIDKYQEDTFSSALWASLLAKSNGITMQINMLDDAIDYSWSVLEWDEEQQEYVDKDRTSDADYAGQKEAVDNIKSQINELSDEVDNIGLLGDANLDRRVNVLDYQKVINMILDPTQQPDEETNLFANVDINQNEVIEVGDLTAIVNYILDGEWAEGQAAARSFNRDNSESLSLDFGSVENGVQRIAVNLENASNYTAFQMDVVLPDGMKIVGTSLSSRAAESHKLYSRTQLDGSIRILASSVKGDTFSGNDGAVLYIDVEGANASSVEILNILFSDVNANTREFKLGNKVTGINAVGALEALKQKIYDLGGRVMNGMKKGINIIRNADGSTQKVAK